MRNSYEILSGKPEGKRPLGRYGADWRIILKSIFNKEGMKMWT
jgi:hypothetical protein